MVKPSRIRVIHTSGTDRDIGSQHAEMLGDGVREGMVRFFSQLWERLTDAGGKSLTGKIALSTFKNYVAPSLKGRLIRQIPPFARERLEGMAQTAGMAAEDLYPLLVLPDFGPVLQAIQGRLFPKRFVEFQPPAFGCSSFFVGKPHFYFGRNLDFPGTAYWDRFPVIQCFDRKAGLKFIGFTSAGIPFGGISGINEAQISVALHQHFTNRYRWDGELPFLIAERILQNAVTLDEAIAILEKSRVASAWAFLLADGKSRTACIVEALPDRISVRRWNAADSGLAHSNYLVSESCRDCETSASARMSWDNFYRRNRIESELARVGEGFEAAMGVKLLGDGLDPYWGMEKTLNRVVSQNYNIKSMLFNLDEMKVWIGENNDGPVHLGHYREYDLGAVFAGGSGETGRMLEGYRFSRPELEESKTNLISGYVAGMDGYPEQATALLQKSLDASYFPEIEHVRSVLLLQQGDAQRALDGFNRAQSWIETQMEKRGKKQPPPELFESKLFAARTLDVLGKRSEAKKAYKALATDPRLQDANLRRIAARRGPYSIAKARSIVMPFSAYSPFQ